MLLKTKIVRVFTSSLLKKIMMMFILFCKAHMDGAIFLLFKIHFGINLEIADLKQLLYPSRHLLPEINNENTRIR